MAGKKPAPRAPALPKLQEDLRGIQELIARKPSTARVELHVECLLADWRNLLDPDAYAERHDALREALRDGVEHVAEVASAEGDDFTTAGAADHAKAAIALIRAALAAVERGALVGVA